MKPGFILNLHNRDKNPLFESHDPSMMWDPESEYYYSYSTDSAITSKYQQGIPVRRSKDLIQFEWVGYALSPTAVEQGRDNGQNPPTGGFWAPYVEYVNQEYRMYYSATKAFGSSESRIILAVAEKPEGPFENRGVVMNTWGTDDTAPNAIDAHVFRSQDTTYLVYGSFFGGIWIKELDDQTGLSKSGDEKEMGSRIAIKPDKSYIDGPEGASVIYNPDNGYYYLFLSYGWLGDNYDVRVGRSKNAQGPYLDYEGKNLNGDSHGLKLLGSYFFTALHPYAVKRQKEKSKESDKRWKFGGFRGPGHGVPFRDERTGRYFFVHHVRDGAACFRNHPLRGEKTSYRMHYMMVRRMFFVNDWPVMSPEPYAGEEDPVSNSLRIAVISGNIICSEDSMKQLPNSSRRQLKGKWEWIVLQNCQNRMTKACCDCRWIQEAEVVLGDCFDFENTKQSVMITGLTYDGHVIWGKPLEEK